MMTLGMMLVMILAMHDVDADVGHNVVDVNCDRGDQLLEIKWNNIERSTMLQKS
jgi:hypothetical protein